VPFAAHRFLPLSRWWMRVTRVAIDVSWWTRGTSAVAPLDTSGCSFLTRSTNFLALLSSVLS
jgi:hypothetical protein